MLNNRKLVSRYLVSDIFWLSILLLVLYSLWLGSYPLFMPDEGRYSAVAREMLFTHDYITPKLDGIPFLDKPILYYWLQALAMKLFGVKEWALRFFPMLLAVINSIVLYVCTNICFNRRTAILTVIVLSSMPLYFCGAHYANLDLEVAAFISMTLACFMTGLYLHTPNRKHYFYSSYLFAALAFLTKGMIGIVFPVMIAGLWIFLNWRWDLLKKVYLWQGLLLFTVLVAPWYILVQHANPDFFHFFFVTQQVTRFLSAADFNNENAWWFYFPIVIVGTFPWSVFIIQSLTTAYQHRHQNRIIFFALLWFSVIFIFFSVPHAKTVGYIIAATPPLAILIAYYLDAMWNRSIELPYFVFSFASILIACGLVFLTIKHPFDLPKEVDRFLYVDAACFVISATMACMLNKKNFKSFIALCFITSNIFLLSLIAFANYINLNTVKPLVTTLNQVRQPGDEIINYYKYYQDLTVYLGEPITLVADWQSPNIPYRDNWVRELWYGMEMQKEHPWLIDDKTFLSEWNKDKRIFVFVNRNYFNQFKKAVPEYHEIARYKDIILLSNKSSGGRDAREGKIFNQ